MSVTVSAKLSPSTTSRLALYPNRPPRLIEISTPISATWNSRLPTSRRYPFSADSLPSPRFSRKCRLVRNVAAVADAWSAVRPVWYRVEFGSRDRSRGARGGRARAERASRQARGSTHPASDTNSSR